MISLIRDWRQMIEMPSIIATINFFWNAPAIDCHIACLLILQLHSMTLILFQIFLSIYTKIESKLLAIYFKIL